jgi:hypothetical protein
MVTCDYTTSRSPAGSQSWRTSRSGQPRLCLRDTISAGRNGQYDPYYIAAVPLAAIAWLLTFAGPVMISKLPQAAQSAMNDYYSGIPGLAIALTGYLITHRPIPVSPRSAAGHEPIFSHVMHYPGSHWPDLLSP